MNLEMSTGVELRQAQVQRLMPQMLQSLKYLQATAVELRDLIRAEAERNPTLEVVEGGGEAPEERGEEDWDDDSYEERAAGEGVGGEAQVAAERHERQMELLTAGETLGEHLEAQLAGSGVSPDVRRAAEWIIGNLDDGGWLAGGLGEVPGGAGVSERAAEEGLSVVQGMDPPGVGARDLAECLWLQLREKGFKEGSLAVRVAREGLEVLAKGGAAGVALRFRVGRAEAEEAVAAIRGLDPRPGLRYTSRPAPVVVPELEIVEDGKGGYAARLLTDGLPELRVNEGYAAMAEDAGTAADARAWIKRQLRSGKGVIRNVERRRETLLRIGQLVAERQGEYFREGLTKLRAMTLAEAAKVLGVHETTVGRASAGKYARTPQGVRELRYFFTTGLALARGGALSHEAVRGEIARLVAGEDAAEPMSDRALAEELRRRGVDVARRTVAKYREQLGIEPAHKRRWRRG
jgi:RNA polymerase sigma-54 factor